MNTSKIHIKLGNVPIFDGNKYVYWSKRMQTYIISLGFDVWILVKDGYTEPKDGPTTNVEIADYENNATTLNSILASLNESEFF